MTDPYIIAEAAQGYEGSSGIAKLLVRGAAVAKADAVKFQIIYAADLCEPGYQYFDLFTQLEMPTDAWREVCDLTHENNMHFIADVFGRKTLVMAEDIGADAYKLHSTNFFDDALTADVLATGKPVYLSVGGIEPVEITALVDRHRLKKRGNVTILSGYQAEPTPINANNLARMKALEELTGLPVGFMDHSDADGAHAVSLSALAVGLGARVLEKHITLDRAVELEDYVSGLAPREFAHYVAAMHGLVSALGSSSLEISDPERIYRSKALKRVVAARDLAAGHRVVAGDVRLSRPAKEGGLYKPVEVIGQTLKASVREGQPIDAEMFA